MKMDESTDDIILPMSDSIARSAGKDASIHHRDLRETGDQRHGLISSPYSVIASSRIGIKSMLGGLIELCVLRKSNSSRAHLGITAA